MASSSPVIEHQSKRQPYLQALSSLSHYRVLVVYFFYTFIHFFLRTTEVELPHFGGRFPILKGKNRVPSFEKPDFRRCLPVAKTTCNHEKVAQSLF